MSRTFFKNIWINFTQELGGSIVHPQFTVIKFQNEAIEEAKKYVKGNLVDIGCGRMPYRKGLEPLVDSYTGVDHPQVSKLYKSNYKIDAYADAKKLPFKDNTFDIALLLQVLEHVDDPNKVVKEAARVLKPKGVLIISVPFFYPLHDMPYDWGRYTPTALRGFIDQAGFKMVEFKTQGNFIQFWLQMLNTFLVKRINDMVLNLKITSVILLIPILAVSLPIILINNMLVVILTYILPVSPNYPNYFPLDYLIVARKK